MRGSFLCLLCFHYFLHFLYILSTSACLFVGRGCNAGRFPHCLVIRFVLVQDAKPFRNFPARLQLVEFRRTYPGLRVRFGVIDDDLQFQGVVIQSTVALGKVCRVAARIPKRIVPELVVKTNRVDDEGVSFPLADGISQIGGIGILGKQRDRPSKWSARCVPAQKTSAPCRESERFQMDWEG